MDRDHRRRHWHGEQGILGVPCSPLTEGDLGPPRGCLSPWECPPDPCPQAYEELRYKLSLEFPSGYPYTAPTVRFLTPCYHPNVDTQGNICLDILKDKWSALYDVRTILLSIQSLLAGGSHGYAVVGLGELEGPGHLPTDLASVSRAKH